MNSSVAGKGVHLHLFVDCGDILEVHGLLERVGGVVHQVAGDDHQCRLDAVDRLHGKLHEGIGLGVSLRLVLESDLRVGHLDEYQFFGGAGNQGERREC